MRETIKGRLNILKTVGERDSRSAFHRGRERERLRLKSVRVIE